MDPADNECPVCFGDLGNAPELCSNHHKVCDICRPRILGAPTARCPLCREHVAARADEAELAAAREEERARWHAEFVANLDRVAQRALQDVGGHDALGRRGGGRAHNGPIWDAARNRFLEFRERGDIPADAVFGGIHQRNCGHRGCQRSGGDQGVRFLLYGTTGKRRYRCEEHTEN